MTISMLLGKLMPYSLIPGPRTSFEYLLFRDYLSILYVDLLYSVDFSILVELNGGFNIGVLLFGLIVRVIRI